MPLKSRILLVEDDTNLGFMLMEYLETNGFETKLYRDGESGYRAYSEGNYDLCVLDLMLPKMDGFTLAQKIREDEVKTPIIMLTARSMDEDKIKGFKIGVDDYVTKPFNEEELVYRINAILSRYQPEAPSHPEEFSIGGFTLDTSSLSLNGFGLSQRLTKKEFEVLLLLCLEKNKIVKRSKILEDVWGEDDYFTGRSLDVFVSKLRKYLQKDTSVCIETVPNVGLMLKTE
ncbi:response regulator transcription factor [Aureisphaera galaxeae]|uniref:response regulator transcription factor n=1 Tax=Aureisphaera galaxeae TaxID=1538023 RepID=UPI002350EEF2|nr:response regulator transcription factor [Aureisphaera galaxeae]MDC8005845.1 response regulator transcription factor [Aureisphaera galaxeae]